jgi:hypothetical protein
MPKSILILILSGITCAHLLFWINGHPTDPVKPPETTTQETQTPATLPGPSTPSVSPPPQPLPAPPLGKQALTPKVRFITQDLQPRTGYTDNDVRSAVWHYLYRQPPDEPRLLQVLGPEQAEQVKQFAVTEAKRAEARDLHRVLSTHGGSFSREDETRVASILAQHEITQQNISATRSFKEVIAQMEMRDQHRLQALSSIFTPQQVKATRQHFELQRELARIRFQIQMDWLDYKKENP